VKLQSERKEIRGSQVRGARYVGAYPDGGGPGQRHPGEQQLFSKLGNHNAISNLWRIGDHFFPKVVTPNIEFTKNDAQGQADR
jgi:hypothetical protein